MEAIDVVITWVDGDCPSHRSKRRLFAEPTNHPESTSKLRWEQNDEIAFCLRSIERYAPWVRRIFIVTDEQIPPLYSVSAEFRQKIEIVDHAVIFSGYDEYIPTFNSVSINTVLYRIPGLSEQYIYFNDDIFLTDPAIPTDFFRDGKIVLRGTMGGPMVDGILFTSHRKNVARMLGIEPQNFFKNAHMCIPMLKSLSEDFFATRDDVLRKNISHRFRSHEQFLPSALNTHLALAAGRAVVSKVKDWHFVTAVVCQSGDRKRIAKGLRRLRRKSVKMACVNDLESAKRTLWSAEWRIAKAIEDNPLSLARHVALRWRARLARKAKMGRTGS